MKYQHTPIAGHPRTAALQAAIDRTSNMPKHQLAPTQYAAYTPTFQGDPRPISSPSNRRTRYVAKGILSVHNLLDAEHFSRADDETEDLKEMIMEHLGCSEEEASWFTATPEGGPEENVLDIDPEMW